MNILRLPLKNAKLQMNIFYEILFFDCRRFLKIKIEAQLQYYY